MSKRVFKYRLSVSLEPQCIAIPLGAEVFSFGFDPQQEPCIWAVVNPVEVKEPRRFLRDPGGLKGMRPPNARGKGD